MTATILAAAVAVRPAIGAEFSARALTPQLCKPECDALPRSPDLNGDGLVDFSDVPILVEYIDSFDPRADFNDDGQVDLSDIVLFTTCTCEGCPNPPPPPPAQQGAATIGVYFDAAGTITTQMNVPNFSIVSMYVVAHGIPTSTLGTYTFRLEIPPVAPLTAISFPAGMTNASIGLGANSYFVTGGSQCTAGSNGTVLLAQFSVLYVAGLNVEVGLSVEGVHSCMGPSDEPSYLECGSADQWKYFLPEPNGAALINPADFNGNGIADILEAGTLRIFQFVGTSDGVGWSMGVRGANAGSLYGENQLNEPLPIGATPADFAAAFIAGLSALSTSLDVQPWLIDGSFSIEVPGADGFELGVGPYGTSADCWMPPGTDCTFNPTIQEITAPASTGPANARRSGKLTNYPNPFNPRTIIAFDVERRGAVTLRIYDAAGRAVRTLLADQWVEAGAREVIWDGRDDLGRSMAAGVYHYRLNAGGRVESRRMVLLK